MLSRLMWTKPLISQSLVKHSLNSYGNLGVRTIGRDARQTFARTRARGPTLKERIMSPAGPAAFNIGRGALAGGAAVGVGALCFYGLGLGSGTNTLENSHLWPQHVRSRVKDTYLYLGSSLAVTAASAIAVFRTPALVNLAARGGWMSFLVTGALMIGSGALTRSIPYQPGFGTKQLAWLTHSAIIGGVIVSFIFKQVSILDKIKKIFLSGSIMLPWWSINDESCYLYSWYRRWNVKHCGMCSK